jgi:hypothetical protein
MTLNEFVSAIVDSKITESKEKTVIDLFNHAGSAKEFTEETARSWLNGKRRCKTSRYFPHNKLNNENGFINYFKSRAKTLRKVLIEAFRLIENDNIVECDEDDEDKFYRSLMYQFMAILNIPWTKEPINDILPDQDKTLLEQMRIEFMEIVERNNMEKIMHSDPTYKEYFDKKILLSPISRFIETMQSYIITPYRSRKLFKSPEDEKIYIQIQQFICVVENYKKHLAGIYQSAANMPEYRGCIDPKSKRDSDFKKEIACCQEKMILLYKEITGEEPKKP